ncbi:MAG: hypothetical protein GXZ08_08000 [Tissierellia bacterium]|nr:hypothetical protein [Tissierellia bacterium]
MLKREYHFPPEILFSDSKVKISLYQPLMKENVTVKQNVTRFKNLVGEIYDSLSIEFSKGEVEKILKPLYEIGDDLTFWHTSAKGLAILLNENEGVVYELGRDVPEVGIVSDSFHIKPLLRNYQSVDHYYVLGLGKKNYKLFEGNRYSISEINLGEDAYTNMEDLLGTDVGGRVLNAGGYGGKGPSFHGHNSKSEEEKKDIEKFYRHIDKYIIDNFSKEDQAPVFIVGLPENQGEFRRISKNPLLVKNGINKSYEAMDDKDILEEIWTVLEPSFLEKTRVVVEKFNTAQANFNASSDIAQVAKAAVEGRISQIMIEADRIIPGKIDTETGVISTEELRNPQVDDVLDDLAEIVLSQKGEVVILTAHRMPGDTGCAAIFRY